MDSSELYSHSYAVHLGFWTNWSHGAIKGATVTLSRRNGGFLIAFLAIYVGMAGKSFWRLGCFWLHYWYSSAEARDGLYHQRQAILRNSDTAQDGAWRLFTSMRSWRRRARQPIRRLLSVVIGSLLLSAAFGVASIFSSHVTTDTANEVLLTGDGCGILDVSKSDNISAIYSHFKPYHAQLCSKFLDYGLQCYSNSSASRHADGCNLYTSAELPLIGNPMSHCPFNETMCTLKEGNLMLDTGRLNSLKYFGINAAPKDQFDYRIVHECAPLVTEGFVKVANDTRIGAVERVFYGEGANGAAQWTPWTFEVPLDFPYDPFNGTGYRGTPRPEYNIGHVEATAGEEASVENSEDAMWLPIPQLQRSDADVFIMFLAAPGIRFTAPVDDPWFSAHRSASVLYGVNNKSRPSWIQDSAINALGCTTQVQFCNPEGPASQQCEPLRGLYDPVKSATIPQLFPSKSQQDLVKRAELILHQDTAEVNLLVAFVDESTCQPNFYTSNSRARYLERENTAKISTIDLRTIAHLLYGLALGYQGPLPSNQWQLEAEHWVKGELVSMQDAFVRVAGGSPDELSPFVVTPEKNDTAANTMCRNQKIVSTEYSSFNVLGICLILLIGSSIVLLDMTAEPIVRWVQKHRKRKTTEASRYAVREWSTTSTLQLQRLAHEKAGYGQWDRCGEGNPVTAMGDLLAQLDVQDMKHPMLKQMIPTKLERCDTAIDTLVEDDHEAK